MATLIPANGGHPGASAQSSNVEATYEDMFKEITRKLYGEETGNGLHTLGTPVAQVATSGPTAVPEGEQRSFTNLQQLDRSAAPSIEYESSGAANGATTSNNVATSQANVIQQQQQQQQTESGNSVVVTASSGVGGATVVPAPSVAVGGFKSEDHLSTAFGLAALMQNGFAAGQAGLLKAGGDQQQRWAQDGAGVIAAAAADQQPQLVQWTTGGKLQSYAHVSQQQQQQLQQQQQQQQQQPQQQHHHQSTPKSKKHRQEHAAELIYASPSTSANAIVQNLTQSTPTSAPSNSSGGSSSSGGSRKKSSAQAQAAAAANGVHIQKRYACTHCPYSTDRRDLYTRHENIHKDEKPFQCYACLKQFNRADHVKKHFLRMHRELQYDINKTRRHVSAGSSSGSGSSGNGNSHHSGGRGNVTINATGVNIDNAFLEAQRHPTSTSMSIVETIEAVASAGEMPLAQLKQEKLDDGSVLPLHVGVVMNNAQQPVASSSSGSSSGGGGNGGGNSSGSGLLKPKREKRFTCCYCPWSGADKWGLKRHLNTHTKPFVCLLCDYKAARSERLATHVLKVHNKRACSKCSYLADTQEEYQVHMSDVHPHDNRPSRSGNSTNNNGNSNNNGSGGGNNAGGNNVSHSQNLNVLRTIGNTLVANNQLNTYAGNAFGGNVGNGNGGNAVTIYTTSNEGGGSGGGNITGGGGGPLQEIIVNPTSMVGWRLSANGSLIPPHDLLTGGLPNASTQKRGSERLFQYLEAEGSDPEDYARLLKMDAISRNTASVAQDFHKAGGVHELKIPANHQLLFNNKLPSQWTTREAAALLYSLSNMGTTHRGSNSNSNSSSSSSQRQKFGIRARQHSTGEDDENTPSSASSSSFSGDEYNMLSTSPTKVSRHVKLEKLEMEDGKEEKVQVQAKAMMATAFLEAASYEQTAIELLTSKRKIKIENDEDQENQEQPQPQLQQRLQLIKSSPAYKLNSNNNNSNTNHKDKSSHRNAVHHNHRQDDKENNTKSAAIAAAAAAVTAAAAAAAAGGSGAGAIAPSTTNQTPFLTQMEYQNLNRIGTQFHNYVKDIINKYYAAETPLMLAAAAAALPTATTTGQQRQLDLEHMSPSKRRRLLSETEEYIEYLRNKEDITLTITPRAPTVKSSPPQPPASSLLKRQLDLAVSRKSPKKAAPAHSQAATSNGHTANAARKSLSQLTTLLPLLADAASKQEYLAAPLDFSKKSDGENGRSSRKQAQPKKIRLTPEAVVGLLRDKYLNRMVRQKLGCLKCNQVRRSSSISFNYHTIGSLALHRYWRHGQTGASRRRVQAALLLRRDRQRLAAAAVQTQPILG
ncbi:protein charlatan isoform X2 [Drosophila obscura]|uniref:protein charlatan isoform X2 n=1 Tax=Drosophila obscura TaxID=7282 RepID=UPI001BB0E544|nr:protein charlatan isoform X2 [Drosophila obscura]